MIEIKKEKQILKDRKRKKKKERNFEGFLIKNSKMLFLKSARKEANPNQKINLAVSILSSLGRVDKSRIQSVNLEKQHKYTFWIETLLKGGSQFRTY